MPATSRKVTSATVSSSVRTLTTAVRREEQQVEEQRGAHRHHHGGPRATDEGAGPHGDGQRERRGGRADVIPERKRARATIAAESAEPDEDAGGDVGPQPIERTHRRGSLRLLDLGGGRLDGSLMEGPVRSTAWHWPPRTDDAPQPLTDRAGRVAAAGRSRLPVQAALPRTAAALGRDGAPAARQAHRARGVRLRQPLVVGLRHRGDPARPGARSSGWPRSRSSSPSPSPWSWCSAFLILSYRETIKEYPSAGGAYLVTRDNFGIVPAQVAGASLLVDYVLTVAVSASAGTAALVSAFEALAPFKVPDRGLLHLR